MSFWEHLDALRGVVLKGAMLTVALCVVLFIFMPEIFHTVILAPCRPDFPLYSLLNCLPAMQGFSGGGQAGTAVSVVNLDLAAPLLLHCSTALWLAVILAIPALMGLAMSFIKPGLYKQEQKTMRIGMTALTVMFYLGVATGYMVVFPVSLQFLYSYHVSADVPNTISLTSYMDTLMTLSLGMGLLFELPLAAWLLGRLGLLHRGFFHRYRRHAVVALIVLAAIITPTTDPFTLMIVFLPSYLLWEAGAMLVPPAKSKITDNEPIC